MAQVESRNRATSSEQSRKEVVGRIQQEGVEFVLLWFTDIEGHLKSFAVTPSEIEGALDDGMGFDGSSITGFNAIEESDMSEEACSAEISTRRTRGLGERGSFAIWPPPSLHRPWLAPPLSLSRAFSVRLGV